MSCCCLTVRYPYNYPVMHITIGRMEFNTLSFIDAFKRFEIKSEVYNSLYGEILLLIKRVINDDQPSVVSITKHKLILT